jgi:DNA-binding NarL/FixJ family response regulator
LKTVRILVADDHAVVRKGLRSILESRTGWEVCGEAVNGREAVALALSTRPDIVVMDINMPELNGLEATRQIAGALADVRILILTAHDSEQLVLGTLSSGARGFVRKADAGEDLIEAVETLLSGRTYFTSSVTDVVMRGLRTTGGQSPVVRERLSPREREVVQLLAEGKSNKEVATRLEISVKTVETHRKHIMAKLELHSLSDLVRYAIQNGIIEA